MPPQEGSTLVPDYGDVRDPKVRARYGFLGAGVSIAGNALLFVLKLALGLFLNSISLIADAFHTLADVGTSVVVILGFRASSKPPDEHHPHGHGRVEYISTLIIAVLLVLTGLVFAQESIDRLLGDAALVNDEFATIIGILIIITALAKELMARFSLTIADKIHSQMLKGDAWHHRSDALASIAVGFGIIGSTRGYPWMDAAFGIIVSLIIIAVGVDLFRRSSDTLIGTAPDRELIEKIEELSRSAEGVRNVHKVTVHDYGTSKVISLHAEVDEGMSLNGAHRVADLLERRILKVTGHSTMIHVDPGGMGDVGGNELTSRYVRDVLGRCDELISFHGIQMIWSGSREHIRAHVIVDGNMSVEQTHRLAHRLERSVRRKCGSCRVDLHFEPCRGDCTKCDMVCGAREGEFRHTDEAGEKNRNVTGGNHR